MSNILKDAHKIVYERTEEKARQYGPFVEGMQRAAHILNGMTGLNVDATVMYKAMIALKLSRESYNHKEDNLLDAVAYMSSMNDFLNQKQ
jgi:hypothetical protein